MMVPLSKNFYPFFDLGHRGTAADLRSDDAVRKPGGFPTTLIEFHIVEYVQAAICFGLAGSGSIDLGIGG